MMNSYGADLTFSIYLPTRIVFGSGAVKDLAMEAKWLGIERVIVVTDPIIRQQTDLCKRVALALGSRLVGIYDGVLPDSGVEVIDEGAALARKIGCDGLISLGGGSTIDTCKGIAIVLTEGGSIRDHQGSARLTRRQTPHIAIPTTAGTGSEVSQYVVVKDRVAREKMHFTEERILPDCAILDPEMTLGMPPLLTAATGLDALTHAIEAFTSVNRNPMADGMALFATRLIAEFLPRAVSQGDDLEARGQMLIAANLAGQALNSSAVGLVHAMAHVLGARHQIHHGTANAICLPHVVRWNSDELGDRYRLLAEAFGIETRGLSDEAAGARFADRLAEFNRKIGLPSRLRDVGIAEGDLPALAEAAVADGAIVFSGKFAADPGLLLARFREAL
jgi:alcohol dehydrogenase class IV